jgi:hypothetical protein
MSKGIKAGKKEILSGMTRYRAPVREMVSIMLERQYDNVKAKLFENPDLIDMIDKLDKMEFGITITARPWGDKDGEDIQ